MKRAQRHVRGKKVGHQMKRKYGVYSGMFALVLVLVGAPASRAQARLEANGVGGATVASATSTGSVAPAPSASSPADLDRRIEALETELVELRSEMVAKKAAEEAAASAPAPTPAAAPQDKAPEKVSIASLLGPTSVSGFVDGYYQVNFNHPIGGTGTSGVGFRAFDVRDRTISLNMVELILDKAPDASGPVGRTGYHVALGYGDGINVVNSFDPAGTNFARNLKEAYLSYLAPIGKGLQIDFGKFVTPMGAEVIESKDNWNYSRGMLFTWAVPFYHFGLRAKYTFNDKVALTGYLVNGWNNVVDNNSGKTYGFSLALTPTKKLSIIPTYLAGSETSSTSFTQGSTVFNINGNNYWRQTWDLVVAYNPTSKLSFLGNFDYGRGDRNFSPIFDSGEDLIGVASSQPVTWYGVAAYVKYAPNDKNYVAARYEYFEDHDGFMTLSLPRQHFNTITATYQRTISTHLLTRLEYRRDMSHFPAYNISTFSPQIRNQDTLSIGMILLFDSRDAK
jgi:hypothetical protein